MTLFFFKRNDKIFYTPFENAVAYKRNYILAYEKAINQVIDLVRLISKKEKNAVVIIVGDHGYRQFPIDKQHLAFESFCAIKMLNREDNIVFPKVISNVNIFRWVGNKYFGQNNFMLENKKIGHLYKN